MVDRADFGRAEHVPMEIRGAVWRIRDATLELGPRPLVMGILNVTPDSFSDGGEFFEPARAVARAHEMADEGADLIDVGGESTRPGAEPIPEGEELARVLPVIEALAEAVPIPLSVDTTKAAVARAAVRAGARIINDIGGLRLDARIADVAAETGAGLVLMHMQGEPRTMQRSPHYGDLVGEVCDALMTARMAAEARGVEAEQVVLDPGFGFGKTAAHNWELLDRLDELGSLGRPLLVGTSRKSFLRARVGSRRSDLMAATLVTSVAACLKGARIVRVHDVAPHRAACEALAPLLSARAR